MCEVGLLVAISALGSVLCISENGDHGASDKGVGVNAACAPRTPRTVLDYRFFCSTFEMKTVGSCA